MKQKSLFIALFALLAINIGCKKDEECTIKCLNNGQKTENCDCLCSRGYTGTDCSKQKTPKAIYISQFHIYDFPSTTPSGSSWDADGSAPDLYVVVHDITDGVNIINESSNYYANAQPLPVGSRYSWTTNGNLDYLFIPGHSYSVEIYDEDIGTDQLISQSIFEPYFNRGGFPSELSAYSNTAGVSFDVWYDF